MNTWALLLAVLIGVSRVAGRKAGGDSFTAGLIFFFTLLSLLILEIVVERSFPYHDPLVTIRSVIAFALLAETGIDLVLSIVKFRATGEGKYLGYALLFLLFFSFLVAALIGDLPVGLIL